MRDAAAGESASEPVCWSCEMLFYLCFHRGIDSTLRSAFIESATDQHGVVEVNSCFCDELSLLIAHCSIQTDFTIPQKLCANAEFSQ